jgi:hypothetical protein
MNIVITDGGRTLVDFEVAEDSHVYVSDGVSEFYREWNDMEAPQQLAYLKLAGLWFDTLKTELAKLAK